MTNVELSLTVPIVNTLAFLFTVLGEWYVEGKVISKGSSSFRTPISSCADSNQVRTDTSAGMGLMLVGIALCVQSKS